MILNEFNFMAMTLYMTYEVHMTIINMEKYSIVGLQSLQQLFDTPIKVRDIR